MKPKLSFWDIWNMSFGFLGIQFGFALQGTTMTRIFQTLGADQDQIPGLWLAAPMTGLLVQPIIGYMSDRTWSTRFGRRKPYFLIGAILSSLALFFVPYSPYLWMAAGFLWILDASINISMEPFRALVADKLPDDQRSFGFIIQTLIIGIGTYIASNLTNYLDWMGFSSKADPGVLPETVKYAFAIGATIFLTSIIYTILTTKEYPPEDDQKFKDTKKISLAKELKENIWHMPSTMVKLGLVQFFSWFAFFTMWSMSTPALSEHVFQAPAPHVEQTNTMSPEALATFNVQNEKFQHAADLISSSQGIYGLSSMAFALLLSFYTAKKKLNRKYIHLGSLILGGLGFIGMYYCKDKAMLDMCYVLVGISWGSILSMPYAMLSSSIDPSKMGISMGIFNMFIVLPQIIAALGGVNFAYKLIGPAPINAMIIAGISLIIAGLCNLFILDEKVVYG